MSCEGGQRSALIVRSRALLMLAALLPCPAVAQERAVPYWASISAGQAVMRTGPDRGYPALWLYHRRDLPVRVMRVMGAWRQVQERDGSSGWMLAALLSAQRTAIVTGGVRSIREAPAESARILYQAEGGVVGRINRCDGSWCRIAVGDKAGFIAQGEVWGTSLGERLP